ncbi:MAG: cytochrome c biogenesis protein CcsA, partial [Acidimicrobiales bacterium]
MRAPTASAGTRRLGLAAVVAVGLTAVLGLWGTPTSAEQGELYRLVYVHPAMAVVSYLAFAVTAVASLLYLVPRTRTRLW